MDLWLSFLMTHTGIRYSLFYYLLLLLPIPTIKVSTLNCFTNHAQLLVCKLLQLVIVTYVLQLTAYCNICIVTYCFGKEVHKQPQVLEVV